MELPSDVREALLREAKSWILQNYGGRKRKLCEWNDHYTHLVSIRSTSLDGDRDKNRGRLIKLAQEGVIIERPRSYNGQMRSFTLPKCEIERIGQEAIEHWQRKGYVIGVMMDAIQEGPGDE